jgi:hypothetical protein
MPTTWQDIDEEARVFLSSQEFETGGKMHPFLIKWGNQVQDLIARSTEIRSHLQTCSLDFTTSDVSVELPDIFSKMSRRFTKARVDDNPVNIITLEKLNSYDLDHDSTTTGTTPDAIAIEGGRMYITPLWAGTMTLENYFRVPVKMTELSSRPDLPEPDSDGVVLEDLFVAGVLRKGFRWLQDIDMINYYDAEFSRLVSLYQTWIDNSNSQEVTKYTDF